VNEEAWPTPTRGSSREPLPRVEDLPIAEQGYEQESVKAAFDSFYRHAAQLDAALRTLEAVDSFHRQAAALRADLRTLRSAGWTQQPWGATPTYGYGARGTREGISPAVWRIAGEVAFLIAVAVALGVAKLSWWIIALVMAFAFLVVVAIEWLTARDSFVVARETRAVAHPVVEAEAVVSEEGEAAGWTAFEEAQEPSDAMTIIGEPPADQEPPVVEAEVVAEPEPEETEEPEAEEEPQPVSEDTNETPRRKWWRRRGEAPVEEAEEREAELPRHVRVLGSDEEPERGAGDPWEQGFDEAAAGEEPDEDTDDSLSTAGEQRRRFRRR
jgi:hypothetical protein